MDKKFKTNPNYIKRTIAGSNILIPVGEATQEFNGMVSMNESGAFMWDFLKEARSIDELIEALLAEFEVDREMATVDAVEYIRGGVERHMILEVTKQ